MGAGAELGEMVAEVVTVGMLSAAGMVGMIVGGVEVEGEVEGGEGGRRRLGVAASSLGAPTR